MTKHHTPDAILGFRRKGVQSVVLLEFTLCYTERETEEPEPEGLSVRDAAKEHKYQGTCLHLQRLYPAARVRHVTFVMSVFGTMIEEDWLSKLEELG
eukprot:2057058-Rhodomonas_salina.1